MVLLRTVCVCVCAAVWSRKLLEGPQCSGKGGFLCPRLKNQKFKKSENQKGRIFFIFRCRYIPGIRLRKPISRDLDFTHQAMAIFRDPVQTRKTGFPIYWFGVSSIFRLTEVSEFSRPQRGQSTKALGTHKKLRIEAWYCASACVTCSLTSCTCLSRRCASWIGPVQIPLPSPHPL